MTRDDEQERRKFGELVEPGAGIVGGLAGTAVGLIVGGPPGAFAGAAMGPAVEHAVVRLASDFKHRQLSEREVVKVGGALAAAVTRINQRLGEGEQIRQDGFFASEDLQRSAASEIGEGVLLAARDQHEEKKVPLLGNLLASVAFDPEIGRAQANLLLRLGRGLSYRQLCVLALLGNNQLHNTRGPELGPRERAGLRGSSFLPGDERGELPSMDHTGLFQEIADLGSRNLVTGTDIWGGMEHITPSRLRLRSLGTLLCSAMQLADIEDNDVNRVVALLR